MTETMTPDEVLELVGQLPGIIAEFDEAFKRELNIMCEGYEGCANTAAWSHRCEGCSFVALFCSPCKARLEANITKAIVKGVTVQCVKCNTPPAMPLRFLPL